MSSAYSGVMLEVFQNFEQMTARISPLVLIGAGVAALLVGLLIWLGGLSLGKLFVAIAGAVCGVIVGLFVIGRSTFSALLSAAIAAVIAIIFEKIIIILLAAILAAAICFAVLAGPYIERSQAQTNEVSAQAATTGTSESIEELKAYALDVGEKIKQAGSQMPVQKWAVIAAPAAIIILGGLTLRRFTSALYFSVQGTLFIFAGMILLLLYKGTRPVSHIRINPSIYASVFAAMTAFGTIEQLLICKRVKTEPAGEGKAGKNNKGRSKN